MPSPMEDEHWARLVILLLVGLYIFVIMSLMFRFLLKTCHLSDEPEWFVSPLWRSSFPPAPHEIEAGQHNRRSRLAVDEAPPPSFPAALKCPCPASQKYLASSDEKEQPPPTYEMVILGLGKTTNLPLHLTDQPQVVSPNSDLSHNLRDIAVIHV